MTSASGPGKVDSRGSCPSPSQGPEAILIPSFFHSARPFLLVHVICSHTIDIRCGKTWQLPNFLSPSHRVPLLNMYEAVVSTRLCLLAVMVIYHHLGANNSQRALTYNHKWKNKEGGKATFKTSD